MATLAAIFTRSRVFTKPRVIAASCWVLVVPGCVFAALRLFGWDSRFPLTQLVAFTPYAAAASIVPLVVVLVMRRWWQAGVAMLVVVALCWSVLPRWFTDGSTTAGASGPHLRVLTANVLAGAADPVRLLEIVREQRVDVLALQELTPSFLTAANNAGLATLMPHQFTDTAEGT